MANIERYNQVRDLVQRCAGPIREALPLHLPAQRAMRAALTTIRNNPGLLECPPETVLGCILQACQLGLELDPVLGHAYLVPRWNKRTRQKECQFQIGYRGLMSLAHRTGKVARFGAHEVRKNDLFEFSMGSRAVLNHSYELGQDRGEVVGYYAEIATTDGGHDFEVMSRQEVEEHRRKYADEGSRPWAEQFDEMAKKTVIRRLAKRLQLSPDFVKAAMLDEYNEAGAPTGAAALGRAALAESQAAGLREELAELPTATPAEPTDDSPAQDA